ncbi:hypothetical protein CYMTET_9873 [Cymbomonas tetramitiformis]|uniref:Uncharacterized protein n=1 Tax=Cymbomonas tetramitiformis TaxID=36881 RepID=A0AAE0GQ80_9CHLO|nr:hypothetical protein CYMTET_9873 [Cymbomonas tetramitiformis]
MANMSPEMIKFAQEQMAKMSPEQRAQMQQQAYQQMQSNPEQFKNMASSYGMNNFGNDEFSKAADAMKNMNPEDWDRMNDQMKNMTPEQMNQAASQYGKQSSAQAQYAYRASLQLKTDGNKLHGEGKYEAAAEKYARAKNNLQSNVDPEAKSLRKTCTLNLASCYLKLEKYDDCVSVATEVISADRKNMKALYRRGQAYTEKGEFTNAVRDLRNAFKLSDNDETIKGHLEAAEGYLKANHMPDPADQPEPEEPEPVAEPPGASSVAGAGPPPAAFGETIKQMKENPEMMKQMSEMMKSMPPEQLATMSKAQGTGMPEITPEMAKQASDMMANMSPEQMESMMKMAEKMGPMAGAGAGGGTPGQPTPEMMEKMSESMKDPAMREAMSDMMRNIDPEMMKNMSKQMGRDMSDAEAEATANMMKNMRPQDMEKLMTAMGWLQRIFVRVAPLVKWAMAHKAMTLAIVMPVMAWSTLRVYRWMFGSAVAEEATVVDESNLGYEATF